MIVFVKFYNYLWEPTLQILSRDIKLNFLSLKDFGIEEKDVVLI